MQPKASRSDVPQPAALILSNQQALVSGYEKAQEAGEPVYHMPQVNEAAAHTAAKAWAAWERSDPWAYARTLLHIRRGYVFASDVLQDANAKLAARQGHHT